MIMYLKSSLSISAYSGCVINCKYCILSTYRENNSIKHECDEQELCENTLKSRFFVEHFTPITINNVSDPFLNKNLKESTFKIINFFEKKDLKNPIILITKGYLNSEDFKKISKYKCNIHVFYTYSGLSETMENRVKKLQIETINGLSQLNNIKLVHYWRPVIEGVNSSDIEVSQIVKEVGKYFNTFVVSGIRLNTHLSDIFKNNNIPINIEPDTEHKIIKEGTFKRIRETILLENPKAAVFRKTSCVISFLNDIQDINGYSYDEKVCNPNCLNFKTCMKGKEKIITNTDFEMLLNNISKKCDFLIYDDYIEVDSILTQEESSYLKHNTKRKIKAIGITKSNSEDVLSR